MTTTAAVLIPSIVAVASDTTQYTSASVTTIIDKFTATNYDTVSRTITVNLVPSGGSASTTNQVVRTKTLQAGETYTFPELVGHVLDKGGFISTIASNATGINIRASGRVIS